MCCVCRMPRAFVTFPEQPFPLEKFFGVATFQEVAIDGPFTRGMVDKLILFDVPESNIDAYGWFCFKRVLLRDILIFVDNVPNLFDALPPPPTPPPTYTDLLNMQLQPLTPECQNYMFPREIDYGLRPEDFIPPPPPPTPRGIGFASDPPASPQEGIPQMFKPDPTPTVIRFASPPASPDPPASPQEGIPQMFKPDPSPPASPQGGITQILKPEPDASPASHQPPQSAEPLPFRILYIPDPIAIPINLVNDESDAMLVFQPPAALI